MQLAAISSQTPFENWWAYMRWYHVPYLRAIPDITLAFGVFGILGLLRVRRVCGPFSVNLFEVTKVEPLADPAQ